MNDLCTSETPSTLTNTMPTLYSTSTRQRTLAAKHLSGHDDDPESIYKDALIIQIFQHWRIKTLEHQHNEKNNAHFSQALQGEESSAVKDESAIAQPPPTSTLQKRVTPPPASYTRRKENLRRQHLPNNEPFDPKFLTPSASKAKSATGSINSTKKAPKSTPVFIEPKKTHPHPLPRPFALPSFDESLAVKPKSPGNPIVFAHGHDDDETSDQESREESLYIRRKAARQRPTVTHYVPPEHVHIPTAVFVTNPQGRCQSFDFESESLKEASTLPHSVTLPSFLDQYSTLQSIGEEVEEEEETNDDDDADHHREIDPDRLNGSDEERRIPLGRRWSDGVVSDEEQQTRTPSEPRALMKMASSVSSVSKPESPSKNPVKISKTKYLLMKLHLTPAVNKAEEPTNRAPRRTVRRSSDKKRYQTQ